MARAAIPNPTRLARSPVNYARSQPVSTALLIWLGLVAIAAYRAGGIDRLDMADVTAYAVGALVVIIAAAYLPDLVVWMLLAILVVATVRNRPLVQEGLDTAWSRLQSAFAAAQ